jgi:hypothetical protein
MAEFTHKEDNIQTHRVTYKSRVTTEPKHKQYLTTAKSTATLIHSVGGRRPPPQVVKEVWSCLIFPIAASRSALSFGLTNNHHCCM